MSNVLTSIGGRLAGTGPNESTPRLAVRMWTRNALHDFDWWKMGSSSHFVRLAGINGAAALLMFGYGVKNFRSVDMPKEQKVAFEAANIFHLIHSAAMMAAPMGKYPLTTGLLFASGTLLFSGSNYCYGIWGCEECRYVSPVGGFVLMLGWLSLVM